MKSGKNETICVVTVTYGDRGHLLKEVLTALAASSVNVDKVIIVDNGSISLRESLYTCWAGEIDIVKLGMNTGSAAGFKAGLQRAAQSGCDLIWLLDDDNVPEPRALEALLVARKLLGNSETHVFAALRLDRDKYVRAATTEFALAIKNNAFLGFSLTDLPRRVLRKIAESSQQKTTAVTSAGVKKIGYGIYGGLLFHRSWLAKAGYPNEDLYLYMDDTEYTTRLVQKGAEIYLVPEGRVKDIDISWHQKSEKKLSPLLDMDTDIQKLYYTVRNSCFLSLDRFVDCRVAFFINIISYISLMFIKGILAGNPIGRMVKRFRVVAGATLDGIAGRLGCKNIIPGVTK